MKSILIEALAKIHWITDMKERPLHYCKLQLEDFQRRLDNLNEEREWVLKERNKWIRRLHRIKTKKVNASDFLFPKDLQKQDEDSEKPNTLS